jgi:hypothetical protein
MKIGRGLVCRQMALQIHERFFPPPLVKISLVLLVLVMIRAHALHPHALPLGKGGMIRAYFLLYSSRLMNM